MIKIKDILTEDIKLFSCEVLIRTTTSANKVEIYNKIRAIKGVVVVTIRHSDFLDTKSTDQYEWSLLYIKFIVNGTPSDEIKNIGTRSLAGGVGDSKIDGLIQFIPRYSSLKRVASYTKSGQ